MSGDLLYFPSPPVEERCVSRVELADLMAVSTKTIDRWVRAGMPSETWGIKTRVFQPSRCIQWARARGRMAS